MTKFEPCSGYRPESGTYGPCAHGFPQTAVCAGISADVVVPCCCDEKFCSRHYERWGGKPPLQMPALTDEGNQRS